MSTTPLDPPSSLDNNTAARASQDASSPLSPSTSYTSLPPLPPEVIQHIILATLPRLSVKTQRQRYDTLLKLSLVNSTWRTLAQRELRRHVFVTSKHAVKQLSKPGRQWKQNELKLVHSLYFGDDMSRSPLEVALSIFDNLPEVHSLLLDSAVFRTYDLSVIAKWTPKIKTLFLTGIDAFDGSRSTTLHHLETLAVNGVKDGTALAKVLESHHFPNLKHIIYYPTVDHTTEEIRRLAHAMSNLPTPLESLAFVDWDEFNATIKVRPMLEIVMEPVKTIRRLTVNIENPTDLLDLPNCSSVEELRIEPSFDAGQDYKVPIPELKYFIEEATSWKSLKVLKLPRLSDAQRTALESAARVLFSFGTKLDELEKVCRTKGIRIEWEERRDLFDEVWEDLVARA